MRRHARRGLGNWLCGLAVALALAPGAVLAAPQQQAMVQEGLASWYGAVGSGRHTGSGERFDPAAMTAAHRTLPFGTLLRVTNLENGRSVVVRVNDRGPPSRRFVIDLSEGAARALDMRSHGVARVRIERVSPAEQAKE